MPFYHITGEDHNRIVRSTVTNLYDTAELIRRELALFGTAIVKEDGVFMDGISRVRIPSNDVSEDATKNSITIKSDVVGKIGSGGHN